MKYAQVYDGEWQPLVHKQFLGCCDCRLIHLFEFRKHKGKLEWRAFREQKKTMEHRRRRGIQIVRRKK